MDNITTTAAGIQAPLLHFGGVVLQSWISYLLPLVLSYPLVVASLRFRRIRGLEKKFSHLIVDDYATMTDKEAFEVINIMLELEFPTIYRKALQFALFRTYGIPTISSTLIKTTQVSTVKNAGKRFADTGVLVAEIWGVPPGDERHIDAIARLNFIHSHYIKRGLISKDQMLYALAQFMLEPIKWITRYEWRKPTPLELHASGIVHKSIGDAMCIDFSCLPSASAGFRNGLHFFEELSAWQEEYEAENMVPDPKNHKVANETTSLLLLNMPKWMRSVGFTVVRALMDERLRKAMMYDGPPPICQIIVSIIFHSRRLVIAYLYLPRLKSMAVRLVYNDPTPTGHRQLNYYESFPFYVKPTLLNRYGPRAWYSRLLGLPLPGDAGYLDEGFKTPEVGPTMFAARGEDEMRETRARLGAMKKDGVWGGACPFAVKQTVG